MRNLSITVLSLVLTTVVVGNAYYQKKQFYPTVVYITKSNPSMAVIYLQAFILVILSGKLMRKVFFGELRAVELEHLMERSWYAVTETCLAFTVFRDDFSPKFVALFTLLLFLKSFHWLAEERVDFMERSPVISLLFHIRIVSLLLVLGALDLLFVSLAYQSTLTKGASVQLVFGFEYAILLTIIFNIVIKYTLHSTDIHREMPWEHKAVFLLYTELIMGLIKVILYVMFVFIMVRIYTLPLFAFRPMYYTVRAFRKAFNDVIMSRRAIRNMNTLYPDATPEELAASDNVCIICREEMHAGVASKKLPCNHIFHTSCLRSWFQRQQTCPTCRLNILRTPTANQQNPVPQQRGREQQQNQAPQQQPNFPWNRDQQNQNNLNNVPSGAGQSNARVPQQGPTSTVPPNVPGAENMPFFCPPFPYSPFNIPPPMPPFQGLSDDDLRKLESQTREGLEARIRCLENIQTLLDVSVVMMQQYCAAASVASKFQQSTQETRPSTSKHSQDQGATNPDATASGSSKLSNSDKSDSEKKSDLDSTPKVTTSQPSLSSSGVKSSTSSETDEVQSLTREQELARQRRLEMFAKIKPNNTSD